MTSDCMACKEGVPVGQVLRVDCKCMVCRQEFQMHLSPKKYLRLSKFLKKFVEEKTREYEKMTGETIHPDEIDAVYQSYLNPLTIACGDCLDKFEVTQ